MPTSQMDFPRGREVVLGIGASIAAYKSCDLLRRLQEHGFLVTVVPTANSLNFVGKATWEALSGRIVRTDLWSDSELVSHVGLGERADLIIIAPASADLLSRLAAGRADDLLTTTVLASQAPIVVVPAMHPAMWLNAATVANVKDLRERGMKVIEPAIGRLTGSDSGIGRFPETSTIIAEVEKVSRRHGSLRGKKVLITTGGTREAIDPVRFLGNRSSGRQGLAVAYEALAEGAQVTIIAADTVDFDLEGARVIDALSADEMFDALKSEMPSHDALVMAAAVADVRPLENSKQKIKKSDLSSIPLQSNPDLIATMGKTRRSNQVLVGFAAETEENFEELGLQKLTAKGVDLLYVTNVQGGAVFGESETSGSLLDANGVIRRYQSSDKFEVAKDLVRHLAQSLGDKNG